MKHTSVIGRTIQLLCSVAFGVLLLATVECGAGTPPASGAPCPTPPVGAGPPIACGGTPDCKALGVAPYCSDSTPFCGADGVCAYKLKNDPSCPCIEKDVMVCQLTSTTKGIETCYKNTGSSTAWGTCTAL